MLSQRGQIEVRVFYTWEKDAAEYDKDFGKKIEWDIPLLEGYDHVFVSNEGSFRRDFAGVKNPGLIREIESWGADALWVYGWNYRSHLRAMRYFKGRIPVIFRGDSTLLDEKPGWKTLARRWFLRWVYRHVDMALYVGSNNKKYYNVHGLRDDQLMFAPHAIDNDRFFDTDGRYEQQARSRRRELGIPEDGLLVVFVGKFQDKKDPLLLISAFEGLEEAGIHLLMVGDGELEQTMKHTAAPYKHIHFLPFQNQSAMPVIYRIGDVFCLPSRGPGETWGLAVNEAMACGRPVLVSDRCGCAADLVQNGRNGYIFTSGDKAKLTEKLQTLLSQKHDLGEMGKVSAAIIQSWSYQCLAPIVEKAMLSKL